MKLKYDFVTMEMEGKTVAVAVGDDASKFHGMLRLNDTAACIFQLLHTDVSLEMIVEAMKNEYDAPETELRRYVEKYIQSLADAGLLEEGR